MPVLRLALILALLTGIDSTNTQRASPDRPGTAADTPATDHAVGYYDERLQRVVLVGGAGDPKPGPGQGMELERRALGARDGRGTCRPGECQCGL